MVRVKGSTVAGDFAPSIGRAEVELLGRAPMPNPDQEIESAFLGQQDSRWLKLRGVVQDAVQAQSDVVANLVWGKHSFKAHVQAPLSDVRALIDREVSIQGACGSVFNSRRQVFGIQLFVPGKQFISPESPSNADPFQLPLRPAGSLLQFSRIFDAGHRSRIRGLVTLANPAGPTWIRDESEGLEIETHNELAIREGDVLDVVGFPAAGNYGPVLKSATVRKVSSGSPVLPIRIDAAEASMGKAESQLIQLDANLLQESVRDGVRTLRMQSGTDTFSATIPDTKPFPRLVPGARLSVTGICSVNADDSQGALVARGFRLNLRSAADVTLLESAPWFTMERLALTLAIVLALSVIALVWIVQLRRNVRSQTRMLSAKSSQLEAASAVATEALARALAAESLEQSRRCLMESIANDEPLETIMSKIAGFAEKHSSGTSCSLDIQLPGGARMFVPSSTHRPPWGARDPLRHAAVPVLVDGNNVGAIKMDSTEEAGLTLHDLSLLPSWSQFASLAIERRGLYEKLSFRAEFDALTGLHNRSCLYERLSGELVSAKREGTMLAVLYMDLNGFKTINDTFGHDAGDRVLRQAAERIRQSVRRSDLVARIGGDEFVVVLSGIAAEEEASRTASLLRSSVSQPMQMGSRRVVCGTSLGIGLFPRDGHDVEVLLNYADQKMYAEKAAIRKADACEPIEVCA